MNTSPLSTSENKKEGFFSKHKSFFAGCYYSAYILSFTVSFFELIATTYQAAQNGKIAVVIFNALFMTVIISFRSIIGALVWGTLFIPVFLIPYLVIRGLRK